MRARWGEVEWVKILRACLLFLWSFGQCVINRKVHLTRVACRDRLFRDKEGVRFILTRVIIP